jgi:hypothetical protein
MNKLILFFYLMSNIISAQSGFSTIIPRPEEYVEGIAMPAIELNKDKIVAVSASNYRTYIGLTAFYNELNSKGEVVISRSYLDSINRVLCYHAINENSEVWMCGVKFISKDTVHYAYLAKLDSNFDTIWTREYPSIKGRNLPAFDYMIRTKTGNLCAVGVDNHNDPATDRNRNNSWMLLVDSMGNFINSHHLPKDFSNGIEGYHGVKTDSNGCIIPGCTTDFITEKEPHKDLFLLSPNPTQDYVNVYMNDVEFYDRKYYLNLYDQQGRIVQHHVVQGRVTQVGFKFITCRDVLLSDC